MKAYTRHVVLSLSAATTVSALAVLSTAISALAACLTSTCSAPTGTQGPRPVVVPTGNTNNLGQSQQEQQEQQQMQQVMQAMSNDQKQAFAAAVRGGDQNQATKVLTSVGVNNAQQLASFAIANPTSVSGAAITNSGNGGGATINDNSVAKTTIDSRNFAGTGVIFQPGQSVVVNARTSYLICLPSGKVHVQTVEASPLAITFQSKSLGINASLFGSLGFGFNNSKVALDQQGTAVSRLLQSQFVFDGLNSDRASSNNELTSFAFGIRAQRAQFSPEEITKGQVIIAKLRSAAVELDCKPTVSIPTTPVVYLGTPGVPTAAPELPKKAKKVPGIPVLY